MAEILETIEVAVGIVLEETRQKVLLAWNDRWGGFTFPMTKMRLDRVFPESPENAAVRAVAEVFHLPARQVHTRHDQREHKLMYSQRDDELKGYNYHLVQVEIHPDYRSLPREHRPYIWVPTRALDEVQIRPVTSSVIPILNKCRELEWV